MRHNFSKRKVSLSLPNLSSVQLDSYEWLKKEGIQEVLDELGTVEDYSGRGWILTLSNPAIEKENISVDDNEVEEEINHILDHYPGQKDIIVKVNSQGYKDYIRHNLTSKKTMLWLKEKAAK